MCQPNALVHVMKYNRPSLRLTLVICKTVCGERGFGNKARVLIGTSFFMPHLQVKGQDICKSINLRKLSAAVLHAQDLYTEMFHTYVPTILSLSMAKLIWTENYIA